MQLQIEQNLTEANSANSLEYFPDDMSGPLSPVSVPAQKQLKYTPGIVNGSSRDSAAFMDRKMVPLGHHSMLRSTVGQAGKLWSRETERPTAVELVCLCCDLGSFTTGGLPLELPGWPFLLMSEHGVMLVGANQATNFFPEDEFW
ncbi:hypothetical protein MLD38_022323 [Melastoma candidum]|uniref:Uncharacterized protein n=1 Tax=Melastoma candidum TaxID=119954 RepID=A0ACB9QI78_9MYRT|nr:hypothetical protein MLD38_022323 [Melastoma candidum]